MYLEVCLIVSKLQTIQRAVVPSKCFSRAIRRSTTSQLIPCRFLVLFLSKPCVTPLAICCDDDVGDNTATRYTPKFSSVCSTHCTSVARSQSQRDITSLWHQRSVVVIRVHLPRFKHEGWLHIHIQPRSDHTIIIPISYSVSPSHFSTFLFSSYPAPPPSLIHHLSRNTQSRVKSISSSLILGRQTRHNRLGSQTSRLPSTILSDSTIIDQPVTDGVRNDVRVQRVLLTICNSCIGREESSFSGLASWSSQCKAHGWIAGTEISCSSNCGRGVARGSSNGCGDTRCSCGLL